MKILQPPDWPRPKGYSNGISARGQLVFVSGIVGWNQQGEFVAMDFAGQVDQALQNIVAILKEANARPEHIVRITWYVLDKNEYMGSTQEIGTSYRTIIGKHYPAMTVVQVAGLVEENARVEIEVTAVIPES
ncbi:MAG TPA: RidA family protein [Candidatus Limnocylindrales bacterium]|jgi:enamine deaminase RidA (YjgF/YER057c/UK114 family)|nr:RidA family protein [Candidatus Limnocylindrales bacterium]